MRKIFNLIALALIALSFASCYEPSPLYGTWADNTGNTIVFMSDNTYSAKVTIDSISADYQGTYSVVQNALVFTHDSGTVMVTEWDIRGSFLYLYWTDSNSKEQYLSLTKCS